MSNKAASSLLKNLLMKHKMHHTITSLMQEIGAVDWHNQRVDACKDDELRVILAHNRDEEK